MVVAILFPFVLTCAVSDLRTSRIPNTLILCGLSGALLSRLSLLFQGFPADSSLPLALSVLLFAADGAAGFLLPWILLGPLVLRKMLGGGDVKLLSALGLWLGAKGCLRLIWYSLLFAGAWSVLLVLRRRNLIRRLCYLYDYLVCALRSGKKVPYRTGGGDRSGEFCFALPVLAAFVTMLSF